MRFAQSVRSATSAWRIGYMSANRIGGSLDWPVHLLAPYGTTRFQQHMFGDPAADRLFVGRAPGSQYSLENRSYAEESRSAATLDSRLVRSFRQAHWGCTPGMALHFVAMDRSRDPRDCPARVSL